MFGIVSARDFFGKSQRDYRALADDVANADIAMNAILSNYHLHEWVWALCLKPRKPLVFEGASIRDKGDWISWLEGRCPHFLVLRDLANGSKHCLPAVYSTSKVEGFASGPWGIGPFGAPYLLIDMGDGFEGRARWLVASEVLREVSEFWAAFFEQHVR